MHGGDWSESGRPPSASYRQGLHGGTKAREVRFDVTECPLASANRSRSLPMLSVSRPNTGSLLCVGPALKHKVLGAMAAVAAAMALAAPLPAAAEVKVGVSDWPGWVAWYVAEQKGFFKKHGADVK